jgi:hypothetical protein
MQLGNHYSELVKKVPDVLTGLVEKGRQRPIPVIRIFSERDTMAGTPQGGIISSPLRRTNPKFRQNADWFNKQHKKYRCFNAGLLDLSRYVNL